MENYEFLSQRLPFSSFQSYGYFFLTGDIKIYSFKHFLITFFRALRNKYSSTNESKIHCIVYSYRLLVTSFLLPFNKFIARYMSTQEHNFDEKGAVHPDEG